MKKFKFLSLITSFALTFSLLSCGGGGGGDEPGGGGTTPTEDTTPPVANNVKPANNAIIELDGNSEGKIEFSADLADNVNLASYSIEIHQNVEGHIDPKSIESRSITRVAFSYPEKSWDVSGKTASVKQTIEIKPINNQIIQIGSYHFVLTIKDAAGNKTVIVNELQFKDA